MELAEDDEDSDEQLKKNIKIFQPGVDRLEEGEVLDYDSSAYQMLHRLNMEWPCLTFDILLDKEGFMRTKFPHTVYTVAGTQADEISNNKIFVLKAVQLHRTKYDDDSEPEDDDEEDLDDDPIIEFKSISHPTGAINRIRSMPQQSHIIASWSDCGKVFIWNILGQIKSLDGEINHKLHTTPLFAFGGHKNEGFAMDWSKLSEGKLATGDCSNIIHVLEPKESQWVSQETPYTGHTASVEDIQWSPSQAEVFASCGVDKTVKIWDTRCRTNSVLSVTAHLSDVNVISWNTTVQFLLVSGSDDNTFKIWDLRNFKDATPAAHFNWHRGPITSVEWDPSEESVLATASIDNQLAIWDLSLEKDTEAENEAGVSDMDVPAQLLFVHMGQTELKELHYHSQIPGCIMSTASNGFNIFKPDV